MDQLLQQIAQYRQEIAGIVPNGAEALEAYRIRFLGTKGIVKGLFTEMKNVPGEHKKEFGALLNEFKQLAETKYEDWKNSLGAATAGPSRSIDLSLPGDNLPMGTHHPISLVRDLAPRNRALLARRDTLQQQIDDWHRAHQIGRAHV